MTFNRRRFIQSAAAAAGAAQLGFPAIGRAQGEPIRLGLLTVKTGALASGGIDMERGLTIFLKEKNYTMGGRKVELTVADTAAVPAQARTKMQELVERERVHAVVGPLAAFEALAMDDYIRSAQIPTLPIAGAEDMTQRKANPWFVRATSTSAQCSYPMADYCAKTLKYKRMAAIADDFAYGHESVGGFQKVFEDAGGTLVQKLFSPLNAPDYGSAIAALRGKVEDKQAFIKALRAVRVETLRGPIEFDEYGNVVGNIYIRKVEKRDGRLVNTNIHTYPKVSQFWTYDSKEFLKHPVWSRDYPPMKSTT